jgi:patatin-like phospholipase/acyl hydrolase
MNYIPPRRSDGTIQHTRIKLPWPKDRLFRILSIDGGGIRGVFPAAYLSEIEKRFLQGQSIARYFDMIAGTSTGGIIALALAHGLTAEEALKIYAERGNRIFPTRRKLARWVRWTRAPKYDSAALRDELLGVFGEKVIDAAMTRLIIPSFEGRHGEPFIYKTPHHPDYQKDRHKNFAHVALHTAAAPTYFEGVDDDGYVMLDGGLWANNPVMNAIVDALACYDITRDQIRVLSLGTGDSTFTVADRVRKGGLAHWAVRAFSAASRAQSKNALGQAYLLVGKDNVLRIDVPESDSPIPMDDVARSLKELPEIARALVEGSGHRVEGIFLQDHVDTFVKCPMTM